MHRVGWLLVGMTLILGAGCGGVDSQEYGQCEAPNDHLKVMFKPKTPGMVFSHSFCVVCNTAIEPEEYDDWAEEMGATSIPNTPELPCLYVYTGAQSNFGSMSQCQSMVCDGTATYSDMVSSSNGNFDLTPVLNGSAFAINDAWHLTEQEAMSAAPFQGESPVDPAHLPQLARGIRLPALTNK